MQLKLFLVLKYFKTNNKMEQYIKIKKQCCEIQKKSWSEMIKETEDSSISSTIQAIQEEKEMAFSHYEKLFEALNDVEDKEFVENERVNMLEKMVELAEFETHETIQKYAIEVDEWDVEIGNNLGVNNFVVRRNMSHINEVVDVINLLYETWTSSKWIAIMGPGAAVNDDIYTIMPGSIQEQTPVELIYFGKDVTEISDDFSRRKSQWLTFVYFHTESKCNRIGLRAFSKVSWLKEIKIPDSVTEIGAGCFYLSGLKKVKLSSNLKSLEPETFRDTYELKNIHIPKSVTSIGKKCFSLRWFAMMYIDETGLDSITGLESVIDIGQEAFLNQWKLRTLKFGKQLKRIGSSSFKGCNNLKEITFKYYKDLTILPEAFAGCDNLDTVKLEIGNSITPINWLPIINGVFDSCKKLIELSQIWKKQINSLRANTGNLYNKFSDVTLYVAYQNQFRIDEAQLLLKLPSGGFIRDQLAGFSPAIGTTRTLANGDIITFNGNGSSDLTATHSNFENMNITYHPMIGQNAECFLGVFNALRREGLSVSDYSILCPLYQKSIKNRNKNIIGWSNNFDYQLNVTGKAKKSESENNNNIIAKQREVTEELNLNLEINTIGPTPKRFPKYSFGYGITNYNRDPVSLYPDIEGDKEDESRQVMVVVLEEIESMNINHVNNHIQVEEDIIGFVRKPLLSVIPLLISELATKIPQEHRKKNVKYAKNLEMLLINLRDINNNIE